MISKKRLLEIEQQRKAKLYNRGSGKRNVSDASGKVGILSAAAVLVLGAGFLIFYANSMTPVKEKAVEQKAEVAVIEEQKEVAVVEEVAVELHPALKKKAEELAEKQDEINLTFYDNLSNTESSPLGVEEKPEETQQDAEGLQQLIEKEDIKEKATVVKNVVQKPEVKPVVPADRNYRIQIASFRDLEEAMRRKEELNQDGFHAVTETADLGTKGVWHRVYVEDYVSRSDAKSDLNKIARKYNIKPFIVKKP